MRYLLLALTLSACGLVEDEDPDPPETRTARTQSADSCNVHMISPCYPNLPPPARPE